MLTPLTLTLTFQHSWISVRKAFLFLFVCQKPTFAARIFWSCRKVQKANSITDIDPLKAYDTWEKPLKQGLNLVIHNWRITFNGSNHSKWDDFFCIHPGVVHTSWAGRPNLNEFCVMCHVLPFSELLLLQYMHIYSPIHIPHLWRAARSIIENSNSNKAKNCLQTYWTMGVLLLSKENPQGRNSCRSWNTSPLNLFLWITSTPQQNIQLHYVCYHVCSMLLWFSADEIHIFCHHQEQSPHSIAV